MNYQVAWSEDAENDLATIWMASPNRQAVSAAAEWFDRHLAREPLNLGESRASSIHRVAYHDVLGLEFEVIEDDKRVIVHGVFAIG